MKTTWPNLFVVGAAKSGTTSIYTYLQKHPDVFMCRPKEPHYFADLRPLPSSRHIVDVVHEEEDYLRLFADAAPFRVRGEASPSYLNSPAAVRNIRARVGQARIIIALRDPVQRAYSHYLMDYRNGIQSRPFFEAIIEDHARQDKGWGVSHLYVELGQYSEGVSRYLDAFGTDNVLVLMFEDLKQRTPAVFDEIFRFIGVQPMEPMPRPLVPNRYSEPRTEGTRLLLGSRWARGVARKALPARVRRLLRSKLLFRPASKAPVPPEAARYLIDVYSPDIERLEARLGRDLSVLRKSWSLVCG